MGDIKSGVVLTLNDKFSDAMKRAGKESKNFSDKTLGAVNKIDKALSGTGAKLAAFGLSLSVGAVTKDIIQLDHRMARVGLTANASAEQIGALKKAIFAAAKSPDIKIDPTEIVSGVETIMTKTGDLKFVEANIRNVGLAIQAAGESGGAMGDVFSEFAKYGYSAADISALMDDMVSQSDQGEFTFAEFAKNAKGVISAYSAIGNTPDDIRKANAAMQILVAGTKSSEVATTVLNSAINELLDPSKREKLEKLGISVRDTSGRMRDFNDIMLDLAAASEDLKKADAINSLFGAESLKGVRAYQNAGKDRLKNLLELGNTTGALARKSATMAHTLQSNIQGLKTSFYEFADSNLTGPLAKLTELLNELTAHPERVKRLFTEISLGLGAIAAVKGVATAARVIESFKGLKSGNVNITESLSKASAMPVYVTNWDGGVGAGVGAGSVGAGSVSNQPAPSGGLVDQYGKPITSTKPPAPAIKPVKPTGIAAAKNAVRNVSGAKYAAAGVGAGVVASIHAVPKMVEELELIKQDEELTKEERGKAKGGAIGDMAGTTIGAAVGGAVGIAASAAVSAAIAGTATGAAIGSVVPIAGTAAGAIVGGVIGLAGAYLGGRAGRALGETLGASQAREKPANQMPTAGGYINRDALSSNTWSIGGGYVDKNNTLKTNENKIWTAGGYVNKNNTLENNENKMWSAGGYIPAAALPPQITQKEAALMPQRPAVNVDGTIKLHSQLVIDDTGYRLNQTVTENTTPYKFETGSAGAAREMSL